MIKAIIFDFDGTILDTETASYRAWMSIYDQYGLTMDIQDWGRFIGTSNKEDNPYTFIKKSITDFVVSEEEIRSEIRQLVNSSISNEDLLPGVKDLILHAQNNSLKLAIATSSARKTVMEHLNKLNLHSAFDILNTSDDVKKVKPDPELYLKTMDSLQLKQHEIIVIEDSPNGALAAVRAGIKCIVVPNPITKNLQFPEVNVILKSLADFDFDLLKG